MASLGLMFIFLQNVQKDCNFFDMFGAVWNWLTGKKYWNLYLEG